MLIDRALLLVKVTDGERVAKITCGLPMLTSITAAGCSVTALITAFVSCAPKEPLLATAFALAIFGHASFAQSRKSQIICRSKWMRSLELSIEIDHSHSNSICYAEFLLT